ncbi:serine/threonine-protein kinase [Singulisphaera sp. PoT]|uniref:serine/threonine-protein kinase n=1 Tax=Singulisphaera sp. PoT TaxID=3411797 RepID=UPI003BF61286
MPDANFESQILRFEQAWGRHDPPFIGDYLLNSNVDSSTGGIKLLIELISIDLEFRWRRLAGRDRFVLEDYAAAFPELGPLENLPLELLGEEYRVRRQWGDRPSHKSFLARFRLRHEFIFERLRNIDAEIEEEAKSTRSRPSLEVGGTFTQGSDSHLTDLLSHQDFLLRRLIGAGAMGKVYEAWQRSTSRKVAVKFLRKTLLRHPRVVQRFRDEADTIARLQHPRIVSTQGLGRTGGGSYFIVMDLVEGPNLDETLRRGPVDLGDAVRWILDAAEALAHAHERGIIHCDLKPANLLRDEHDRIRVTDFGLARSLAESTRSIAEVEGTAPFMAPEQASRHWGPIDERTDVYGLGAVLFTLATGRPPYVGRRLPDILAQVASAAPVPSLTGFRPHLPEGLGNFCRKCLAKRPEERFASILEARSALLKHYH